MMRLRVGRTVSRQDVVSAGVAVYEEEGSIPVKITKHLVA